MKYRNISTATLRKSKQITISIKLQCFYQKQILFHFAYGRNLAYSTVLQLVMLKIGKKLTLRSPVNMASLIDQPRPLCFMRQRPSFLNWQKCTTYYLRESEVVMLTVFSLSWHTWFSTMGHISGPQTSVGTFLHWKTNIGLIDNFQDMSRKRRKKKLRW